MEQRTRILLLTPSIGGGGAQHVMVLVARGLSRERFEVHLGLVRAGDPSAGAMPSGVTVHALGAGRARAATLRLLLLVWRLRPDVILSGALEISFLALLLRPFFPPRTRVLVRQNGTVSAALAHGGVPRYTRLLYRLLYRRADRVICQSRAMAEDLARETGVRNEQIVVLPNPVDLEGILAARDAPSAWNGPGPHLLAVGRLSREKGFDLLIEALAALRKRFPVADLILVGSAAKRWRSRRFAARWKWRPQSALRNRWILLMNFSREPRCLYCRRATKECPTRCWRRPRRACRWCPHRHQVGWWTCSRAGRARGWRRKFLRAPSPTPWRRLLKISSREPVFATDFSRRQPDQIHNEPGVSRLASRHVGWRGAVQSN